jgi:hypothetical protein
MKNSKLFQICYTVNFAFLLLIIGIEIYWMVGKQNVTSDDILFLVMITIVILGFSIFDLLCYHLLRSVNQGSHLSKRIRNAGVFFLNICLFFAVIFSLLFIGGIYEMVFNFSFKSFDIGFYFFLFCFLTITVSGIYLYIGYGKILSLLDSNFTDSIENIGGKE